MTPEEIREQAMEVVSDLLIDGPDYLAVNEFGSDEDWASDDIDKVYEMAKEICNELRGSLA